VESKVERIKTDYPYRPVEGEGVFVIRWGRCTPGHRARPFPFQRGREPIINLEIRLGYVHRGVEKISESTPTIGACSGERISGDTASPIPPRTAKRWSRLPSSRSRRGRRT